jgi:aminobenzoyl-glutamate utilization protein B
VPGTPAHSWQAVAAGGMSIGHKGMVNAAKTIAMTMYDLLTTPTLVAGARAEFERKRGANFVYRPLIGERKPPLDYRVNPK